jgi:hypothetical protein
MYVSLAMGELSQAVMEALQAVPYVHGRKSSKRSMTRCISLSRNLLNDVELESSIAEQWK